MKRTLMAILVFGAAASAMAQPADSLKCAAFTAMGSDDQMAAIRAMTGLMPMDDRMAAGRKAPARSGPAKMPGGDAMSADETFKTVSRYCRDHPDMMVGDAMMAPTQR